MTNKSQTTNQKIQKKPKISIIVCVAKNRGIGKDNKLLFEIPEDLQHFKKITFGHPVIMGYNTFRSIGKPLPGRMNIVLNDQGGEIDGATVAEDIASAIEKASAVDQEEIFFIGGASVYQQTIGLADRLYITEVDSEREADTFFPDYSKFKKRKIIGNGQWQGLKYNFCEYEK
ncbi:MAG: dihydrofolate reductase [Patescibacteria group bacterium]